MLLRMLGLDRETRAYHAALRRILYGPNAAFQATGDDYMADLERGRTHYRLRVEAEGHNPDDDGWDATIMAEVQHALYDCYGLRHTAYTTGSEDTQPPSEQTNAPSVGSSREREIIRTRLLSHDDFGRIRMPGTNRDLTREEMVYYGVDERTRRG